MYIFLPDINLEEEKEYQNYLRMTLEFFGKLFVLLKGDITIKTRNMRDAGTHKIKLATGTFYVHSFVVF